MDALFVARALGFGSLSGFSPGAPGAGGSILTVPILVYGMGLTVQGATVTSLAIVGLNAATGALDPVRLGGGVVGVLTGGKLAGRLPERLLRAGFAVLVLGLAIYTFGRSATTLLAA
jgi:uncharacterized protein